MTESKGINIKAVLFGALVDAGSTVATAFVAAFVWVIVLAAQGVAADEMKDRSPPDATPFLVLSLVFGAGATVLGGYVAGRVAKKAEVLHGGIIGAIAIPIGLLFVVLSVVLSPAGESPLWYRIVSFAAAVPAGMAGGFPARRRRERQPTAAPRL